MNRLELDTDLHCENCVDKITPLLNTDTRINKWDVDMTGNIKKLVVEGDSISAIDVDSILSKEGYSILKQESSFWTDKNAWKRASFNTLNCLIGCSIGDFGAIIYMQAYYPSAPLMWQMIIAIIAGLTTSIMLETTILRFRENFPWLAALKTAFGMSFISMVAMEIAMNTTDFMITGGKAAFDTPVYWLALIPAMIAGFLLPLPYNYFKIKKFNKACH